MKDERGQKKAQAVRYIESHADLFTHVSDCVWEKPELSLMEYEAARLYCEVLREGGFTVESGFGGIETAFTGSFGHGRPVIGILGEYDALSGLSQERAVPEQKPVEPGGPGHGCGHNMLGAGALAAAFALKDYLERTGREGTVIYYGCPGEEGCASKTYFARDGIWKELDAALTWHPYDINEVVSGTNNSCIQMLYNFRGRSAHAANDPYNGRSALDGVELMNTGVQYLREHMREDCRVHYAITDAGGISPNVVQDHASVLYMVRANKVKDCVALLKRVDDIAAGAALMTETSVTSKCIDGTAEVVPNYTLEEALYENFSRVSLPSYTPQEMALAEGIKAHCTDPALPGIGPKFDEKARRTVSELSMEGRKPLNDFLAPLVHTEGFVAGSTDVGDVSWQTPTAQIHTAAFISGAPGHSWQNVSSGGSTIGHKALLLAAKVLAMTGIDLYEDEQLLAKARSEFEKRTKDGYTCPLREGAGPTAIFV